VDSGEGREEIMISDARSRPCDEILLEISGMLIVVDNLDRKQSDRG